MNESVAITRESGSSTIVVPHEGLQVPPADIDQVLAVEAQQMLAAARAERRRQVLADPIVIVINHPLVQRELTRLRSAGNLEQFYHSSVRISSLLAMFATDQLPTASTPVQTPLGIAEGSVLSSRVVVVPILRAGLAMEQGFREILPDATYCHIGMVRDERTAIATSYGNKVDDFEFFKSDAVFTVDPMLASGGSLLGVLRCMEESGVNLDNVRVLSIVAAPEGILAVRKEYKQVPIFTPVVDSHLNDEKFIVPGLGDFGDRFNGTFKKPRMTASTT
jgi:uracil phosphoribosyltransferase